MNNRWRLLLGLLTVALLAVIIASFYVWELFDARTNGIEPLASSEPTAVLLAPDNPFATPTLAATATPVTPSPTPTQTPIPTPIALSRSELDATLFTTQPVIDGDLQEWHMLQGVDTPYVTEQMLSWNGSYDLSTVWRLGWDNQFLYIAVIVYDDYHEQSQIAKYAYYGDSLEIQLDTDLEDWGPEVNEDDFQFVLSPGDFLNIEPGIFRFQGDAQNLLSDAPGSNGIIAAQKHADGYTVEAAIPWSDVAFTPASGVTLGVALSSNDNDTPGSVQQEFMVSHIADRKWLDPTSWGRMILR